ncbi:SMI1/KNR4 family protein [Methylosinus sp. RM1]|uniref:SMI1/KNR4 family protein n=1 Tax=Methylosinus sp. RM1 TaxID=2583817 RepID=UPI00140D396D|nr:SMI1/KNR4 family protein [Methylosinus sp. RM1]
MKTEELTLRYGKRIDPVLIADFEREFGVVIPASYKDLAARRDGVICDDCVIVPDMLETYNSLTQYVGEKVAIGGFICFNNHEIKDDDMFFHARKTMEYMPLVFWFSDTGSAWRFCFDYRESRKNPRIVLLIEEWTHRVLVPIADSFDEFLGKLHPAEYEFSKEDMEEKSFAVLLDYMRSRETSPVEIDEYLDEVYAGNAEKIAAAKERLAASAANAAILRK